MSGDIVDRLRRRADRCPINDDGCTSCEIDYYAADEIERLRAADDRIIGRLRAEADEARTYGRREGVLRAIDIIEEEIGHEK